MTASVKQVEIVVSEARTKGERASYFRLIPQINHGACRIKELLVKFLINQDYISNPNRYYV